MTMRFSFTILHMMGHPKYRSIKYVMNEEINRLTAWIFAVSSTSLKYKIMLYFNDLNCLKLEFTGSVCQTICE